MGAMDGTVTVEYEEQAVVFTDKKFVLDGILSKHDLVKGEVVMEGAGGGNFVLCPDGKHALTPEQTKEIVMKDRNIEAEKVQGEKEQKQKAKKKKDKNKKRSSSSGSS